MLVFLALHRELGDALKDSFLLPSCLVGHHTGGVPQKDSHPPKAVTPLSSFAIGCGQAASAYSRTVSIC